MTTSQGKQWTIEYPITAEPVGSRATEANAIKASLLSEEERERSGLKTELKGDTLEIYFYGIVGWDLQAVALADALNEHDGGPVTIYFDSPGGDAFEGIAMGNILSRYEGEVTAVVDGMCGSAATIPAIKSSKLLFGEGSVFLVHEPSIAVFFALLGIDALEKSATELKKTRDAMASMYAKVTGKTEAEMAEVMNADEIMSAQEAVDMGFGALLQSDEDGDEGEDESEQEAVRHGEQLALDNKQECAKLIPIFMERRMGRQSELS